MWWCAFPPRSGGVCSSGDTEDHTVFGYVNCRTHLHMQRTASTNKTHRDGKSHDVSAISGARIMSTFCLCFLPRSASTNDNKCFDLSCLFLFEFDDDLLGWLWGDISTSLLHGLRLNCPIPDSRSKLRGKNYTYVDRCDVYSNQALEVCHRSH
jgi:hypothetical protein